MSLLEALLSVMEEDKIVEMTLDKSFGMRQLAIRITNKNHFKTQGLISKAEIEESAIVATLLRLNDKNNKAN